MNGQRKNIFFSSNLVIPFSVERIDNKYWQFGNLTLLRPTIFYLEEQQLLIYRHNQAIYIHDYGSNRHDTCSFYIRRLLSFCFLCSLAMKKNERV